MSDTAACVIGLIACVLIVCLTWAAVRYFQLKSDAFSRHPSHYFSEDMQTIRAQIDDLGRKLDQATVRFREFERWKSFTDKGA